LKSRVSRRAAVAARIRTRVRFHLRMGSILRRRALSGKERSILATTSPSRTTGSRT
jgi:hypothetical protein